MEESTNTQVPEPGAPQTPARPGGRIAAFFGKRKVLVLVVAALVVIGAVVGGLVLPGKDNSRNQAQGGNQPATSSQQTQQSVPDNLFAQQYLQGCKDRDVSFTSPPVPMDQMGYIQPLGMMNDGHVTPTDHVYVAPAKGDVADNTYDVVMPADGTVTMVAAMPAQYIGDRAQQTAAEDHRMVIQHNCRYVSIFIHVHQLSDKVQQAVGSKLAPNTSKQISLELKAGDKLGKIGGNPVDWTLADATKTLSGFMTPKLYDTEPWKIYTTDPVSVYTGALKTQMIEKSLRTVEPYGGKIDYDKKGALVGNWFREGTNGYKGADQSRYWDGHLAIVPDAIDPTGTIFSVGNWNGKAAQLLVKGSVDPADITKADGVVKLELLTISYAVQGQPWSGGRLVKGMKLSQGGGAQGTALVQVQDGEKLKVELFPGKAAAQVSGFTDAAKTYER